VKFSALTARVARVSVVAALLALGAVVTPATHAEAAGCNNIEVVFARGTGEAPGVGRVGQAFVSALRGAVGNRSVGVYAVDYPADYDFLAAAQGANDASAHIQDVVNNCPNTKIVLGGYSQGAAVMDVVTSVPFPAIGFTNPLPPEAAEHILGVAVFGNPSTKLGVPLTASPTFGYRAIDLCNAGDPVCSGGEDIAAHRSYGSDSPFPYQAASFIAGLE
jgi:cutinase